MSCFVVWQTPFWTPSSIMEKYAHQANTVSIYQPFVISIDKSFSGKNTCIPILPQHNLTLLTNNRSHFERIDELVIESV